LIGQDLRLSSVAGTRRDTPSYRSAASEDRPMTRTILLAFTAFCWLGVAVDGGVHLLAGDFVVPVGFALAFVVWLTLWQLHATRVRVQVPVKA
jgi:hypothetical protein